MKLQCLIETLIRVEESYGKDVEVTVGHHFNRDDAEIYLELPYKGVKILVTLQQTAEFIKKEKQHENI